MNSGFLVWVPARVQRLALRYPGGCLGIARPKPMTYCTSLARKRANSASLIDPAFFSRSSFSISVCGTKSNYAPKFVMLHNLKILEISMGGRHG